MEEKEEAEIITLKEFVEKRKNAKEEELFKVVLVCKNCGYKDLLRKFIIEKKKNDWGDGNWTPKLPPKPFPPYIPKPKWISMKGKTPQMMIMIEHKEFEDLFYCPKCGSSLVILCAEFIKNNMMRFL